MHSQVNDALEVFGERDIDPSLWMDGSDDGSIRQAHIRIGSRASAYVSFLTSFPPPKKKRDINRIRNVDSVFSPFSLSSSDGTTKADEVLEFGTYRGDQFIPKSLLRSEGDGTLEVSSQKPFGHVVHLLCGMARCVA